VRRGTGIWREAYAAQRAHKKEQLKRIREYAETPVCRMLQLVSHFGDQNDPGQACGLCDVCAPDKCIAHVFRGPTAKEHEIAARIVRELQAGKGRSLGQIHREAFSDGLADRRSFEHVMGALARQGVVRLVSQEFERDGERIRFQRAYLTDSAAGAQAVDGLAIATGARRRSAGEPRSSRGAASRRRDDVASTVSSPAASARGIAVRANPKSPTRGASGTRSRSSTASGSSRSVANAASQAAVPQAVDERLVQALRAWRQSEAKKRRVPAFRILTDRTLVGIATLRPRSDAELLGVSGMGPTLLSKYGAALLSIVTRD